MDQIFQLKSGIRAHVYDSAVKGKYVIDFLKSGDPFYSVSYSTNAKEGDSDGVDFKKVSRKDFKEAILLLRQNLLL